MPGRTSFLSDAELHGLVDGQVDTDRRSDLLQRASASSIDRERIANWQDQSDLIRMTFRDVEREPVPPTLDLRSPVRLHSVQAAPWPVETAPMDVVPGQAVGRFRRRGVSARRFVGALATLLIIGGGLVTAWVVGDLPGATVETTGVSIDEVLSRRALAALAVARADAALVEGIGMPTTSIPDLTAAGFWLTGADMQPRKPASLVFRYRNTASEQVAIGVSRTSGGARSPTASDDAVIWRTATLAFAITGTLRTDRLLAIATSVRAQAVDE